MSSCYAEIEMLTGCSLARSSSACWVDDHACAAVCMLMMNDKRPPRCRAHTAAGVGEVLPRPALPPFLYSEHVASFLRFEAPLPNMLYAVGGRNRHKGPVDTIEMLDTWHNEWVECPRMPRRRAGGAVATLPDGRLIVVGGYDENGIAAGLLASCDVYDPVTESWASASPMKRARWGHGCTAQRGKVYAVGGCSLQVHATSQEAMETLRSCEVYDPVNNVWQACASLQVARSGCRVVSLGTDRIAAVGGCDDVFGRAETQATVEIYDCATGVWELLATRLSQPRTSAAVAAIDDHRFFVAGGAPSQISAEMYTVPAVAHDAAGAADADMHEDAEGMVTADGVGIIPSVVLQHRKPLLLEDLAEGRMGCQATLLRLPGLGKPFPVCDSECVLVVGGERSEETDGPESVPRIRQLGSVVVYDLKLKAWRPANTIPPMAIPRTTVALCVGAGRVSRNRLVR